MALLSPRAHPNIPQLLANGIIWVQWTINRSVDNQQHPYWCISTHNESRPWLIYVSIKATRPMTVIVDMELQIWSYHHCNMVTFMSH